MDLASRRTVGCSMSECIKAGFVCHALKLAYWHRKPAAGLLMHSDRGSQYASDSHHQLRWKAFSKTFKAKLVHPEVYKTRDAECGLIAA
jgi:transposase InsO family protein